MLRAGKSENFSTEDSMSKHVVSPGAPYLLAVVSLSFSAVAFAQTGQAPQPVSGADPLDATVSVPLLTYQSSLSNYRMLTDEKVGNWKEINDTAGHIGGWRVYAREARQPDNTPTPTPAPAMGAPVTPGGHDVHNAK